MEDWKEILHNSITSPQELKGALDVKVDLSILDEVIKEYPMRINPYYLRLIQSPHDPIWKQAIPDVAELHDSTCIPDPLGEENLSPVPNLVHKYPDRVLFLVSSKCPLYCRFCTRKRKVGKAEMKITPETVAAGLDYISRNPEVREVLLSGGDPLMLDDTELDGILGKLHAIEHVEVIRIGTRVPCSFPMRITSDLITVLKKYHPLYINTHFNHPSEITPESSKACTMLADGGIPLGCQTVLLKGVNDDSATLKKLFTSLLKLRVKPYYLFQTDLTKGTNHFRTPTKKGVSLLRSLIGHVSGMAIPTFALDAPGGKGKIRISPQYIEKYGDTLHFTNYKGEVCQYPEASDY